MNADLISKYARHRALTLDEAESEILEIIQAVAKRFVRRFKLPGFDDDDWCQQAILIGLEAVTHEDSKYRPEFPLEHFLHRHVRNRLANLVRARYIRHARPCRHPECKIELPDDKWCVRFRQWHQNNDKKLNLAHPIGFDNVDPVGERGFEDSTPSAHDIVCRDEVIEACLAALPDDMKAEFSEMVEGKLPNESRRAKLRNRIEQVPICIEPWEK